MAQQQPAEKPSSNKSGSTYTVEATIEDYNTPARPAQTTGPAGPPAPAGPSPGTQVQARPAPWLVPAPGASGQGVNGYPASYSPAYGPPVQYPAPYAYPPPTVYQQPPPYYYAPPPPPGWTQAYPSVPMAHVNTQYVSSGSLIGPSYRVTTVTYPPGYGPPGGVPPPPPSRGFFDW